MSFSLGWSSILMTLAITSLAIAPTNSLECTGKFLELSVMYNKNMSHCKKLTTLTAEFSWRLDHNDSRRVRILLGVHKHAADLVWMAWGVNPNGPQMVGTRAIIGIRNLNGTRNVTTYNVTKETKNGCPLKPSPVEVEFNNAGFKYERELDYSLLSATVVLPEEYNTSKLHMVWQIGHFADGDRPGMHFTTLKNFDSTETINLIERTSANVGATRRVFRVIHGVFNIIGWGVLLPSGVMVARYYNYPLRWKGILDKDNRIRFHKAIQLIGFGFGGIGWVIGLRLGHASRHYTFGTHRLFANLIFSFAALQLLALKFKPTPDGPLRNYWNIYHHLVGYSLLVLIGINIFKGIGIFKSHNAGWRWSYVAILAIFAIIFVFLETYSWLKIKFGTPRSEDGINRKGNGNTQQQKPTGSQTGSIVPNQPSTSSKELSTPDK